jgi:hypothetical protein
MDVEHWVSWKKMLRGTIMSRKRLQFTRIMLGNRRREAQNSPGFSALPEEMRYEAAAIVGDEAGGFADAEAVLLVS